MKPRTYITRDSDIDIEDYEHLEKEWWSEDDQMERERDIRDHYEDEDNPDDLININIG